VFSENRARLAGVVDAIGERAAFITPEDYFALVDGTAPPRQQQVLMTFDDGLLSSYEFIAGELTPRGIRALFFVPTAVLDMSVEEQRAHALATRFSEPTELREEQYRTVGAGELRELAAQGHGVMPHSHSHARLVGLPDASAYEREVLAPRRIIESIVPGEAGAFAYPYGRYSALSREGYAWIARTYTYCFTAIGGPTTSRSNPLLLRRDNLDESYSAADASAILDGSLDRTNGLKARILAARLAFAG
jgi:peptidoglycan/xylan/chitin deacetylase (PgdA/CDA1 family)